MEVERSADENGDDSASLPSKKPPIDLTLAPIKQCLRMVHQWSGFGYFETITLTNYYTPASKKSVIASSMTGKPANKRGSSLVNQERAATSEALE